MAYDLQTARAPRVAGFMLRVAAALLDNRFMKLFLAPRILRDSGIAAFRRAVLLEAPAVAPRLPHPGTPVAGPAAASLESLTGGPRAPGFRFETVADFARAYREGRTTPVAVAEKVIAATRASNGAQPPLRAIIASQEEELRRQARESTERYRKGAPLSPFDGVPVAVKDELDVLPYPTTVGTRFMGARPAEADSTVAARLRAAGALLIGKANMHEIGIDTTGFNAHHGTARNPYDPSRYTGGSSSGCGAAVASGLCPVAIGADGGGSIRIPAALCGVVGLKATYGRVSEAGAAPLCWSVAHVGPLGATVEDVALAYAVTAGSDSRDPNSLGQPVPRTDGLRDAVGGLRLGIYTPWLEDPASEIVASIRATIEKLRKAGVVVEEVELPDLELTRVAHAITILSEMATAVDQYDDAHRADYGAGVRLNLALARELSNRDYVRAQQVRTRLTEHLDRIFTRVDAMLTPTTAITAPIIRPDAVHDGESDLEMTSAMMRFVFPTNLSGHPALSLPAGYDSAGMPIGLQLMGRPWEEHVLLRLGAAIEALVERKAPKVHFRLLE
jgi:Asp-tRNA(Asn)/Glu-tRNA(Gln) amidotransferase A subunit family amidase